MLPLCRGIYSKYNYVGSSVASGCLVVVTVWAGYVGLSTWYLRVATVLEGKKRKSMFCIVVSEEVSNLIDCEGVMVLILVSLIGRWLYGTGSVARSSESGGIFFVFWPLLCRRNFLLLLLFGLVTESCLILVV